MLQVRFFTDLSLPKNSDFPSFIQVLSGQTSSCTNILKLKIAKLLETLVLDFKWTDHDILNSPFSEVSRLLKLLVIQVKKTWMLSSSTRVIKDERFVRWWRHQPSRVFSCIVHHFLIFAEKLCWKIVIDEEFFVQKLSRVTVHLWFPFSFAPSLKKLLPSFFFIQQRQQFCTTNYKKIKYQKTSQYSKEICWGKDPMMYSDWDMSLENRIRRVIPKSLFIDKK